MDDKFIIASMQDAKSKEIADILANETARKILDYLADHEASEGDISGALKLPASTVHYNVQKLLKSRLIEVKEFLWSAKGNKINIYRILKKPIVITPKYFSMNRTIKSIMPTILISAAFLAIILIAVYNINNIHLPQFPDTNLNEQLKLKKFNSMDELKSFIQQNSEQSNYYHYYGGGVRTTALEAAPMAAGASASKSSDSNAQAGEFSQTNIQVAGVDEADIVKNDAKYIYTVSNNKILIVDAFPAEEAKIISEINFSGYAQEIFINKDKLVVFGQEREQYYYPAGSLAVDKIGIMPPRYYTPKSFVRIYDITDRTSPVLENNITVNGNYYNSRMIGNYVYFIIQQPIQHYDNIIMPELTSNDIVKTTAASDVYYFDVPDESYMFSTINALNLENDEVSSKTFMMGYTQNMYVSNDNIYLTYMKRYSSRYYYERMIEDVIVPMLSGDNLLEVNKIKSSNATYYQKAERIGLIMEEYSNTLGAEDRLKFQNDMQDRMEKFQEDIAKETEKTVIHRIAISENNIEHEAEGEVPGTALNQFSMDEYKNHFRIATTRQPWAWRGNSTNNLYILNMNLEIKGKIEDLASGERIYSARFLGDRAYMVTFRQIDPLFVISVSNPENPEVLGYLKIPGVSDYLHPYDENHIIGVGRDATDEGRITGMKLSLFDITDFSNPKEMSKQIIGDRGTYSEALNEHKAFLFSKSKNMIVIPVTMYGEKRSFNGAYVFSIDLENGLQLKGNITHQNLSKNISEYYYYGDWEATVRRSLYMENTLYTVSTRMIKMNNIADLREINKIQLSEEQQDYPVYYSE